MITRSHPQLLTVSLFDRAAQGAAAGDRDLVVASRELAHALLENKIDRAVGIYAQRAQKDPLDPCLIYNLARLLPDAGLTAGTTQQVKLVFMELSTAIASGLEPGF